MNLFIYSDESGVFDKLHNEYFVFAGIILLGKEEKDRVSRHYSHVEKQIRNSNEYDKNSELKACKLTNKHKNSIFRSLNNVNKFAIVIDQSKVLDDIFLNKKDKQRFLDYAYKRGIKDAIYNLIEENKIKRDDIQNIYFCVDEHTTATSGKYELKEGLEQEIKRGTYNYHYNHKFPPILPDMDDICLEFCNSKNKPLIRAADIIANNVYHKVRNSLSLERKNFSILYLP